MLADEGLASRQVAQICNPDTDALTLLTAQECEVALSDTPSPSAAEVARCYLAAGIEHIFLGCDYIAFLLAVVLWAQRLWPVVKVVTAFTLSLAALGIVKVPSSIVTPPIAGSRRARHRGVVASHLPVRPRPRPRRRERAA